MPGGWSISNEILFYLTLPLFFIWVRNVRHALWPAFELTVLEIGVTLLSLHYYDYPVNLHMYYFYWFPNQLPIFAMGVLLFFLQRSRMFKLKRVWTYVFLGVTVLMIISLSAVKFGGLLLYFNHYLFGVLFAGFAYLLSMHAPRLLVNRLTVHLGTISFSMYLIHFFFVELTTIVLKKSGLYAADGMLVYLLQLILVFSLTIFVARLSFRYIEEPGIRLGRRIINRL